MRLFLLILACLVPLSVAATPFPLIPPSTRILTAEEVQNYWFNKLRAKPFPKRPSGLYPRKQSEWDTALHIRKAQLQAILSGRHHTSALIAALEHNLEAYRTLGDSENLVLTRTELHEILEHRARLTLIDSQQRSANRVADAAERTAAAAEASSEEEDCETPIDIEPCEPRHDPTPPAPPVSTPPSEPLFPFPDPRPFPSGS